MSIGSCGWRRASHDVPRRHADANVDVLDVLHVVELPIVEPAAGQARVRVRGWSRRHDLMMLGGYRNAPEGTTEGKIVLDATS